MVSASRLKCDHLEQAPSYDEFLEQYLIPNVPVIIGSALTKHWPAVERWRKDTEKQKSPTISGETSSDIDWGYLSEHYGTFQVSVADCSRVDDLGNQERDDTQFSGVVSAWVSGDGQPLYVKDWHLARQVEHHPSDAFYSTPDIFRDDWMNAYYTAYTDDDFRFVYVGAKGTFTPLHRDVYSSYSWSTNICGQKRWWLFPPAQTPFLHTKYGKRIPYDVREAIHKDYPDLHQTSPMIVDQNEGETIFVPSGWYHQVENLTPCISINHNWCNSVNLPSLYRSMCEKVEEVEEALEDVKDLLCNSSSGTDDWKIEWVRIVQDVVKQDAGWNWFTFWRMVLHALEDPQSSGIVRYLIHTAMPCGPEGPTQVDNAPVGANKSPPSFPLAPASLRPTRTFVLQQVRVCYDDFRIRDRNEMEGEVRDVVSRIGDILETIKP